MSAASSDSAAASKRPFDPSLADPSLPSKLQRSSHPDISPAEKPEGVGAAGPESEAMAAARVPRGQRYLVAVEYAGTRFCGSQQQPDQRTVVGVLEEAFHKFVGQPVSVFCSSRTDAGVHALSNVCHVDVERISKRKPGEVLPPHDPGVVKRAVNHFLQFIPSNWMSERSEMESPDGSLVYSRTSLMRASAEGSDAPSTASGKSVSENGQEFGKRLRHRCFVVTARARSFLYHQVRLMVGLLKSVGIGDLTTADVERILDAKAVTAAPPMAPASGLYLANVKYDLSI